MPPVSAFPTIDRVFRRHGLSPVQSVQPLAGGRLNQAARVSGDYVLRWRDAARSTGSLKREVAVLERLKGRVRAPEILAHEIKNPLAGIRGAAQLLARKEDEKDRALTGLIAAEVDRIAKLIDEMQTLSRRTAAGLLSEDIDPHTGELWGNYPQTYSLVGIINCAVLLSQPWSIVR